MKLNSHQNFVQVNKLVLAHLAADRVPIASSGVRYSNIIVALSAPKICPGRLASSSPTASLPPYHSHRSPNSFYQCSHTYNPHNFSALESLRRKKSMAYFRTLWDPLQRL